MKKLISVMLCVSMLFGMMAFSVSAAVAVDRDDIIITESTEALRRLDRDSIPVVEVPGFGETIYRNLHTADESDDTTVFGPSVDRLIPALLKYLPGFLKGLMLKDYDLVTKNLGPFVLEAFDGLGCNPDGTMKEGTGGKYDNSLGLDENLEPLPPAEPGEIPEPGVIDKLSGKISSFFDKLMKPSVPPAVPEPDADAIPEPKYGYRHTFRFDFDWRKDMHTIAGELRDFIERVKKVTGSEQVAITAFSQGNCVVMTYLYEYYYTETDPEVRDDIYAVVFMCGAMNGVAACADPVSGAIKLEGLSLLRFLKSLLGADSSTLGIYYMLEMLYAVGVFDGLAEIVNDYLAADFDAAVDPYLLETFGGIPGFFAMMSPEKYKEAEEFLFATPELQEKYAGLLEKNRYFHNEVQPNMRNIIDTLMSDGRNVGIFAEYGYPIAPFTSDNDRMTDSSICTADEAFGATCAEVDGILGLDYVQAKECECGKNHVSADLQIDASTCMYPDITWFGKNLKHDGASRFWADLVDLIIYSEEQITVWDYCDYPQFMVKYEDSFLVPLTEENAALAIPFEDTLVFGKNRANGKCIF